MSAAGAVLASAPYEPAAALAPCIFSALRHELENPSTVCGTFVSRREEHDRCGLLAWVAKARAASGPQKSGSHPPPPPRTMVWLTTARAYGVVVPGLRTRPNARVCVLYVAQTPSRWSVYVVPVCVRSHGCKCVCVLLHCISARSLSGRSHGRSLRLALTSLPTIDLIVLWRNREKRVQVGREQLSSHADLCPVVLGLRVHHIAHLLV